ncbi:MAG: sialate O-acetylesterase [Verrucomicrobiales bacterium]
MKPLPQPILGLALGLLGGFSSLYAELRLPAIMGDHMVLQQQLANPIWGWDTPGTEVTVTFGGQTKTGVAAAGTGKWMVKLDPVAASAEPAVLTIKGTSERAVRDVLVGEVWICSGQSNMQWDLRQSDDGDLEAMTAKLPHLRLISVPQVGTQELKDDFQGAWTVSTPEAAATFSAVGFIFGRQLHESLGVPVGLIDNAWGGSAAEAWIRRDVIDKDERFAGLVAEWKAREAAYPQELAAYEAKMEEWKTKAAEAEAAKQPPPPRPGAPQGAMTGNHRPGNIYGGVLHSTIGYGIKGAIWYQGESNAQRAHQYRTLFPFMISHWRDVWQQGDFPFYWVQLADFMAEKPEPGESAWAELREAQTMTQAAIPNGGQAVIIDTGEANDIHPRNKREVGLRLARLALARDYGQNALPARSPEFKSLNVADGKATLTIDHAQGGLRAHDDSAVKGFAICGEDRKWVWANATITGQNRDQIEVSAPSVAVPVAVRYAWADNPVCNVVSNAGGLPLTPFRTDDFPMVTGPRP